MAPHSSTLAWKILWKEEPGGLQSMRSLRVGHDRVTSLSLFTFLNRRRKWQPTPVFLPGESQGLEGLVLKLKLQYFGHLMLRADSLKKNLMLEKIECRRKMGVTGWDSVDMSLSKLWKIVKDRGAWYAAVHGVTKSWM